MDRFLAAEQGYRYRMPICKEHQQITKNCPDCVAIDSQEVLDSETLNDKLYTSLYTVPDEKDPKRFYIKSFMSIGIILRWVNLDILPSSKKWNRVRKW